MMTKVLIFCLLPFAVFAQTNALRLGQFGGDRNYFAVIENAAKVAAYPFNADAAANYNTDAYFTQKEMLYAEAAHYMYNLGFTLFDNASYLTSATTAMRDSLKNGYRTEWGLYFNLFQWDEVDTAVLRTTVETKKFELANYGNISTFSYANGDTTGSYWVRTMKFFLGGRTSATGSPLGANLNTFLDFYEGDTLGEILESDGNIYNPTFTISRRSVSRFNNSTGWVQGDSTATAANATSAAGLLGRTIRSRGFYNNFTHFHNADDVGDARNAYFGFLKKQRDTITANSAFVYSTGYGSIVEYSYAKKLVDEVQLTDDGSSLRLNLTYQDYPEIDRSLIQVPVSYLLYTEGTSLEGDEITCTNCVGIRKIGTDTFVVDIAIPSDLGASTTTIIATEAPDYYDFELPELVSATYNSGTGILTITADRPVRASIFHGPRNGAGPWDVWGALRTTTFSTSQAINISGIVGNDLYIGLITEEKQSILSDVYRF